MPIPITIPRLGWNMDEGTFAGWLKQPGESVTPGDRVFSLESEKATEEIESLDGGTLHLPADSPKPGDKLAVGAVIGYLLQPGETADAVTTQAPTSKTAITSNLQPTNQASQIHREATGGPAISPRARRAARDLGVDWTAVRGTGRTGRIREGDVRAAAQIGRTPATSPNRRTIAARMLAAAHTTAPVTLTTTADATAIVSIRRQFKASARDGEAIPGYTEILAKLVAAALANHPRLNSRWDGDEIVEETGIHIGIAVNTEPGLFVPVVRDVPALSLLQVAERARDLIDRARRGDLRADEMRGGTFTITNLGASGIDAFTPIILAPQCAILGIGRIALQPVVVAGQVVARDLVTLSLTFDHRIVDGAPAARFLQALVRLIESPARSLVE